MTNTKGQIKPVLCVVTSHPIKGDTGVATGFWLSELTHPLAVLQDAEIPFELASIRGGQPPIDGFDLSDEINARFWKNSAFRTALANSLVLAEVDASRYSGIFSPAVTVPCGTSRTAPPCSA